MQYKVGKWYWFEFLIGKSFISRCEMVSDTDMYSSEVYFTDGDSDFERNWELLENCEGPATPEQIEACLKAYAERNGYVEGAKVICASTGGVFTLFDDSKFYDEDDDDLSDNCCCIYAKGKWAEIVKEEPVKTMTPKSYSEDLIFDINGQKVGISELIETYKKHLQIKDLLG